MRSFWPRSLLEYLLHTTYLRYLGRTFQSVVSSLLPSFRPSLPREDNNRAPDWSLLLSKYRWLAGHNSEPVSCSNNQRVRLKVIIIQLLLSNLKLFIFGLDLTLDSSFLTFDHSHCLQTTTDMWQCLHRLDLDRYPDALVHHKRHDSCHDLSFLIKCKWIYSKV